MHTAVIDRTIRQPVAEALIPEVLGSAASSHAPIVVHVASTGESAQSTGTFAAIEETAACLQLDDIATADRLAVSSDLSVTMTVDGVRYEFASAPLTATGGAPGSLRVRTPAKLFVLERRRTVRRRLQHGLSVRLARRGEADASDEAITAAILNVSPNGLACRLDASWAARLSVADELCTSFSLDRGNQTFAFTGRIVSITEGGTPGQMVLGIEFIDGGTSHAQEALCAALTAGTEA